MRGAGSRWIFRAMRNGSPANAKGWLLAAPALALRALRDLTVLRPARETPELGASTALYPLVGFAFGLIWLLVDELVTPVAGRLAASAAVLITATAVTGGRWLADAGRLSRARLWARGRGHALDLAAGAPSVALCAVIFAAELYCLYHLDRLRAVGLIFAPVLGIWSMVVLTVGSRAARQDGRRVKFAPELSFQEFGWASVIALTPLMAVTEFLGVLLAVCAASAIVIQRLLLHRWLDGVPPAALGAAHETTVLLTLAVLALF